MKITKTNLAEWCRRENRKEKETYSVAGGRSQNVAAGNFGCWLVWGMVPGRGESFWGGDPPRGKKPIQPRGDRSPKLR